MKAQPHRSSKYFETVCCAGVGRDRKWRRQYPVPFRILNDNQKFSRWSWITYGYTTSPDDPRRESQKVIPESIEIGGTVRKAERSSFLGPLIRLSFDDANSKHESLTLIRPKAITLEYERKSASEIEDERAKHAALAEQMSFLDNSAKPLEPCPVQFIARWQDQDGKARRHECDDWETSSAYLRFRAQYGDAKAIQILKEKYEQQYFAAGLALAFSTHSRRNVEHGTDNQWLLVGLIRLDEIVQGDLMLEGD